VDVRRQMVKSMCFSINVLCLFSLRSGYLVAVFELRKYEISWKINLGQTVKINKNNLDGEGLRTFSVT
jgi:hypothetical protein